MEFSKVIYVMYSKHRHYIDENNWYYETKLHGIFTEKEITKYAELRKKVHAYCLILPMNKFIESGEGI